jgi:hypothetical protein
MEDKKQRQARKIVKQSKEEEGQGMSSRVKNGYCRQQRQQGTRSSMALRVQQPADDAGEHRAGGGYHG